MKKCRKKHYSNVILFFEKAMPDSCILLLNSVKSSQNALHIVLTFLK